MIENNNQQKDNSSGRKVYPGSGLEKREKRKARVRRQKAALIGLLLLFVCIPLLVYWMPSRKRVDPAQYFAGKMLETLLAQTDVDRDSLLAQYLAQGQAAEAEDRDQGAGQTAEAEAGDQGAGQAAEAEAGDQGAGQAVEAEAGDQGAEQAAEAEDRDQGAGQAAEAEDRDQGAGQAAEAEDRDQGAEQAAEAEVEDEARQLLAEQLRGKALAVVLQDQVDYRKALMLEDTLYLNYEMVSSELNERFFWDEESRTMLFTTPLELYEIPEDSKTYQIEGENASFEQTIVLQDEGIVYLAADFVGLFTNMECVFGEDDCHVKINCRWGTMTCAQVRKKTVMRQAAGRKASILENLEEGAWVTVLSEEKKRVWAVTADGMIGYLPKKALTETAGKEITRDFQEPEYTSIQLEEKVRLVWHAIDNENVNNYLSTDTKSMTGINVISPTWFQMADDAGHISSLASKSYVKKAHHMDLQVWGLLSNFNSDVSTYAVVSSAGARRTLEQELLEAAQKYNLDGINIDLELITRDSAPGYVQLLRELSILCRKAGLILSVDVPVPMSFNEYYNRKELGTVTDYVIMMGYDEHYFGSEAGSVASLSFEEKGIAQSLETVPAGKLVSGIPFYTRIWYSWPEEDGSEGLYSDVVSMYRAWQVLDEYGVEPVWDEESGQYFADWTDENGTRCRVWLEDDASIALKAELVNAYSLGGFAAWVLGDEMDAVWQVLEETVEG